MDLREYMRRVYELERSCYEQRRLLARMSRGLQEARNPNLKDRVSEVSAKPTGGDIGVYIVSFIVFMIVWNFIMSIILSLFGVLEGEEGVIPSIIVLLIGIVLYIVFGIRIIKARREEHDRNIVTNQNIDRYNQTLQRNMAMRASALTRQIEMAKGTLSATQQTLQQFYSVGIIYPKYRNFVAVSTFYEYLASGRCTTLEGHEGAYNIYEQEIRMNTIISKLDDVLAHLDRIEGNQYMLASAIREGNRRADQIYETLRNVESNTALSAYYNSITATNTTYMVWFRSNR